MTIFEALTITLTFGLFIIALLTLIVMLTKKK